jgi:hypothetical protein
VQNYAVRVSNCLARVPRSCDEIGGSSTIQAKDFHYKKSRFPNPGLPHPRILLAFTLCLVPFGYFRTNTRVRVSSLSTRARAGAPCWPQSSSRSFSTARKLFAAKLRNSAKRRANQFSQDQLCKTDCATSRKTAQKLYLEL